MPDEQVAAQVGRTVEAVRIRWALRRKRRSVPSVQFLADMRTSFVSPFQGEFQGRLAGVSFDVGEVGDPVLVPPVREKIARVRFNESKLVGTWTLVKTDDPVPPPPGAMA